MDAVHRTGRLGATFLAHDADWQTPAITEAHAYRQAFARLPAAPGFVYLAFPWATLIDQIQQGRDSSRLQAALDRLAEAAAGYDRVVTVCQHVFMGMVGGLFKDAGVTDIYWSHARTDEEMPGFEAITVKPFPLYPVNPPGARSRSHPKHLFSFVGSRADRFYMDNTRALIVEELAASPGGYIREREAWHFHQSVYELQIHGRVAAIEDPLANAAAREYREAMADSLFALCPSGTGPNSLRLWEAIDCGTIPVVISPRYVPPGDPALWWSATISADTNRETIRLLPKLLATISRDQSRIDAMRGALATLRARYGVDLFVYDIVALYREAAAHGASPRRQGAVGAVASYPHG